jgi:hypothetical protein
MDQTSCKVVQVARLPHNIPFIDLDSHFEPYSRNEADLYFGGAVLQHPFNTGI